MNTDRDKTRGRWTLGLVIVGGSICGLMFDWEALYPALLHRTFSYGTHSVVSSFGLLLGRYLLPVVVTFLAPRKSFLWAAAVLGVSVAWSLMDRVVSLNGPGFIHDFKDNGYDALRALLIFCGPISFVRLLLRRHRDGKTQRIAQQQAWMQQASEPQAGVWPPPPIKPAD